MEEEATRQLGFQVSQNRLTEEMDTLGRLLTETRVMLRGPSAGPGPNISDISGISSAQVQRGEELVSEMETLWPVRMRESWDRLWGVVESLPGPAPPRGRGPASAAHHSQHPCPARLVRRGDGLGKR